MCRFCDGEIGRAELEKQRQRETRLRRPAGLVSHSADVATPNYPILRPGVSRLHSLTLQSVSRRRASSLETCANRPRERATRVKAEQVYDTGFKFKSFLRRVCRFINLHQLVNSATIIREDSTLVLLIF